MFLFNIEISTLYLQFREKENSTGFNSVGVLGFGERTGLLTDIVYLS